MEKIQLFCKTCGVKLTEVLNIVPESKIQWEYEQDVLGEGEAAILTYLDKMYVLTNLDDKELINHLDDRRFSGCCGSSGSDGMNKLCKNGHEVAIETSDCCTSISLSFVSEQVIIKEML